VDVSSSPRSYRQFSSFCLLHSGCYVGRCTGMKQPEPETDRPPPSVTLRYVHEFNTHEIDKV